MKKLIFIILMTITVSSFSQTHAHISSPQKGQPQFYYYVTFNKEKYNEVVQYVKSKFGETHLTEDTSAVWTTKQLVKVTVASQSISVICNNPKLDQSLVGELKATAREISKITGQPTYSHHIK